MWRDARCQARDDIVVVVAAIFQIIGVARLDPCDLHDGHPEHRFHHGQRAIELLRRHANDGHGLPVHRHRAADNLWIGCKETVPRTEADHHHRMRTRANVFVGCEESTAQRIHAKHVEVVGRNHLCGDGLRRSFSGDVDELERPRGDTGEYGLGASTQVEEMREGTGVVFLVARRGAIELHQLPRACDAGERAQQHGVDGSENSGVESDADGEREHDNSREQGALDEHAAGEAEILPECGDRNERRGRGLGHGGRREEGRPTGLRVGWGPYEVGGWEVAEGLEAAAVVLAVRLDRGSCESHVWRAAQPVLNIRAILKDFVVGARPHGLGFLFRDVAPSDYGIDGQIEVVDRADDSAVATGKFVSVQVKSGKSSFANETAGGWVNYVNKSTVQYWRGQSVPVLSVIVDAEKREAYRVARRWWTTVILANPGMWSSKGLVSSARDAALIRSASRACPSLLSPRRSQ